MAQEALVLVSCAAQNAETIAQCIVEERLAACVSIVPSVRSIYHWQGKLHQDNESLLLIKTNKKLWLRLEKRVKELHSYEVPEIILLPIELGYAPYLDWLNQALASKSVSQAVQ